MDLEMEYFAPMSRKKPEYEETKMVRDIATIMNANPEEKEWTRTKLAAALKDTYPELSYRELMYQISNAFYRDKVCNNRFKSVRVGVWDLKERVK